MGSSIINRPTLVLNKSWLAVSVFRFKYAICKVFSGMAKFIDSDFNQYSWNEWLDLSNNPDFEDEDFIHSNKIKVRVTRHPIIVLTDYNKMPRSHIRLSKRNVLIRDGFCCQYSHKKLTMGTATLDHIIPKSRGGKTTWDNVVAASHEINTRKGDRTPEEANLKLMRDPKKPEWSPLYSRLIENIPEEWENIIKSTRDRYSL